MAALEELSGRRWQAEIQILGATTTYRVTLPHHTLRWRVRNTHATDAIRVGSSQARAEGSEYRTVLAGVILEVEANQGAALFLRNPNAGTLTVEVEVESWSPEGDIPTITLTAL